MEDEETRDLPGLEGTEFSITLSSQGIPDSFFQEEVLEIDPLRTINSFSSLAEELSFEEAVSQAQLRYVQDSLFRQSVREEAENYLDRARNYIVTVNYDSNPLSISGGNFIRGDGMWNQIRTSDLNVFTGTAGAEALRTALEDLQTNSNSEETMEEEVEYISESGLDLDEIAMLEANLLASKNKKEEEELQASLKEEGKDKVSEIIEEDSHPLVTYLSKKFPYLTPEDVTYLKSRKSLTTLESFIKAYEMYHGDNWSLNIRKNEGNTYVDLVILYPEINITNSSGLSHTIKELYIRISFSGTTLTFCGRIEGVRGLVSNRELEYDGGNSAYAHSHLSTSTTWVTNGSYTSFCLGSSELATLTNNFVGKALTEAQAIKFTMLIGSLVSWESQEGTPYRYINTVLNSRGTTSIRDRLYSSYGRVGEVSNWRGICNKICNKIPLENFVSIQGINSNNLINFTIDYDYLLTQLEFRYNNVGGSAEFLYTLRIGDGSNGGYSFRYSSTLLQAIANAKIRLEQDLYDKEKTDKDDSTSILKAKTDILFKGANIPTRMFNVKEGEVAASSQKEYDNILASLSLQLVPIFKMKFQEHIRKMLTMVHLIKIKEKHNYEFSR